MGKKDEQNPQDPMTGPKLTYSENVRVNIGDFEGRDLFVSYQDNVQPGETPDQCFERLKKFVRKKLYAAEKRHRMATREFVDFDTKAKLPPKSKE